MRDERFLQLTVYADGPAEELIGVPLSELQFPPGALLALVHRDDASFVPTNDYVVEDHDRLTIIGNPDAVESLRHRFDLDELHTLGAA